MAFASYFILNDSRKLGLRILPRVKIWFILLRKTKLVSTESVIKFLCLCKSSFLIFKRELPPFNSHFYALYLFKSFNFCYIHFLQILNCHQRLQKLFLLSHPRFHCQIHSIIIFFLPTLLFNHLFEFICYFGYLFPLLLFD